MLRDELAQIILEEMPPPQIELTPAGELLSHDAMEIARLYDHATPKQRAAFDALAENFAE